MGYKKKTHTLVISDVHLGSPVCMAKQLTGILEALYFERLILLGDIFDSLNFMRLCGRQWKLFDTLRHIAKEREVIWMAGNHDAKAFEFGSAVLGAMPIPEDRHHLEEVGGRVFYMAHGHQFDEFIPANPRLTAVASGAYLAIQQIEPSQTLARSLKKSSKQWLRLDQKVGAMAVQAANDAGADIAVCGHTHQAGINIVPGGTYINTGCWTDVPATMLCISKKGNASLCQVSHKGRVEVVAKT